MGLDLQRVRTRVLGLVLVLALVGVASFALLYTRPLIRPDELEHFESVAARALQDVNEQRCTRPSIGASSEEDGTARFSSLLAGLHQLDARGWQGPRPLHLDRDLDNDEALFDAMDVTHMLEHVRCVPSETAESCLRRFVNRETVSPTTTFLWPAWAGPRAAKEASQHAGREEFLTHLTTYWHGALMEEAHMRALLGVVAARLHTLRTGTCPDVQTDLSGDAMRAGFGGTFPVRVRDDVLEIDAPAWLDELAPEALDPEALTLTRVPCTSALTRLPTPQPPCSTVAAPPSGSPAEARA